MNIKQLHTQWLIASAYSELRDRGCLELCETNNVPEHQYYYFYDGSVDDDGVFLFDVTTAPLRLMFNSYMGDEEFQETHTEFSTSIKISNIGTPLVR